ncbi:hypothetical protein I6N90_12715 [Paenibacillus sp. GSMTC-2017]|nr:hypothetical protein [Paenibacillus sp. GSMTC-2017]
MNLKWGHFCSLTKAVFFYVEKLVKSNRIIGVVIVCGDKISVHLKWEQIIMNH